MARLLVSCRGSIDPSLLILLALVAGAATGLFFGELITPLQVVANGYVQLLRMTVLPYVTVSLIAGVGSLTPELAHLMFTRVGATLVVLWSLTLALVFLMPATFPRWESASFFSTTLIEKPERFDFLSLYIPENPFHSLANSVVPAVVLFSVVLGIALIRVTDKEVLLDWLRVVRTALGTVTTFMVRLAPIGLFAIAAVLAGTLRTDELERVQVFLITYGVFAALLALWIVPGLVCALTPVRYGELFGRIRDPLVTAFLTGELFVVLPLLSEASRDLVRRHAAADAVALTDVIVPTAFNFPHAGKVLSLSFILFAGWFSETPVSWTQYPTLALTGVLSFFASLNAAVPYLLDFMRIPADTFQLFLATGLINSRVGTAVAAVHTLAVAIIGACAATGHLRFSVPRLVRYATISVVLVACTAAGLRLTFEHAFDRQYDRDRVLTGMHLLRPGVNAIVHRDVLPILNPARTGATSIADIRARNSLRVGYLPDSLPFAFFNDRQELVGFDVEMAHRLAREMGVSLEFVPADEHGVPADLARGAYDLLMSGVALTTRRAEAMAFSTPYLEEHMAFVVEDHRRAEFMTLDGIRRIPSLRVAIPDVRYYAEKLHDLLPAAQVTTLRSRSDIEAFFTKGPGNIDALAFTAERGSAWSLLHPRFAVAVPQPQVLTIPLAYPTASRDGRLVAFLDRWIELKKRDGTIQELYDYWILGRNAQPPKPRWSIIRDVLHWTR